MWYWRQDYFKTLRDIAADAERIPAWSDYAAFCLEYERGLRKQAFATLDRFVFRLERAPFPERRGFVSWLMNATDGASGQHMAVPHPLRLRIVEPTLVEWTAIEPTCSEPHRWLGGFEHLESALDVDPTDEIARRKLVALILGCVDYATHELPSGYIGDPQQDIERLGKAKALVDMMSGIDERQLFAREIEELRALIQTHLRDHR